MSTVEFEKPCPMCGGLVDLATVECPHCGESLRLDPQERDSDVDRKLILKFHREARALAGFWIFGGLLSLFIGWMILSSGTREIIFYSSRELLVFLSLGFMASGSLWIWSGVLTAMKRLPGVTLGLRVSYVIVLLNLAFANIPGILLIFLVILQGWRVLKNGRLLQAAGLLEKEEGAYGL